MHQDRPWFSRRKNENGRRAAHGYNIGRALAASSCEGLGGRGYPQERVRPPDTGYGFLWRLYSYWRLQEREDGVYVECRAVSLTRDVPFGLGWVIEPIIQKLPKESLINTLEATRRALRAAPK